MDLRTLDGLKTLLGLIVFSVAEVLQTTQPDIALSVKLVGLALASYGLIHKRKREHDLLDRIKELETPSL